MDVLAVNTENYLLRFGQVREQTEALCRPLLPEDTVVQPIVDVSPPKWHLAHTSWFFETFLLQKFAPNYKVFHPDYNFLFNSYYNSIGSRILRQTRGTLNRPPLAEIYQYRAYVNEHITELLNQLSENSYAELLPLFELGLQHEQQHQELLVTDIKYILSTNPLVPALLPAEKYVSPAINLPKPEYLSVASGLYEIGYTGTDFCFDNELSVHQVWLDEFAFRNQLVTNQEYLEFMEAGGYQNFKYWLHEGFDLAQQEQWEAPLYWTKQADGWYRFTLHGLQKVNVAAPVTHISFYEADAFANWAGKRLLTEFEWEVAAKHYLPSRKLGNFLENGSYDPQPFSGEQPAANQLLGDVWEWTYSAYQPYPRYNKAEGALGEYNGKFMINQMVLRGGSCATPRSHIRPTYRNFFHPDKRWQFTGIRLAAK
ncbi:ergothioneine biosynthesis protein EgtB [Adhaeribacter arboris]|uniref:Ergothioneine biosynthesis protein EgtB n=1 Tax=Adhaeribacter arboris TaxID=2072846 RepID=A0A2T2YBL0_9BACT|nr:ergothioneine biosynthesis protein EgtB [Adhaeribacter arboris]PSR52920.1 ergothioneine biosynthesis protein EgtB [Adhaeribacter arboris]